MMKPKWFRVLSSLGLMVAIYFVPDGSLQSVKRALEVIVVAYLCAEVLRKMQRG